MRIELTEVFWLHEHDALSVNELAELSGLSEAEINELVDYGAITPIDTDAHPRIFAAHCIVPARTARRLRDDFDLNTLGVALALTYWIGCAIWRRSWVICVRDCRDGCFESATSSEIPSMII